MKLRVYKNKYGYERVDCPFCGYDARYHKSTHHQPDSLRGLKTHITNAAKNEALAYSIDKEATRTHLDYYINHTTDKKVVQTLKKRHFDSDLEI